MIATRRAGRWLGVLIEGGSGCGKSDLALRAMRSGWRLVADDRVLVWTSGDALFGRAPGALSGLIEARGLGVVAVPTLSHVAIVLAAACADADVALERVPLPETRAVIGVALPLIRLQALQTSALAKLEIALEARAFDSRCGGRIERSFGPGGAATTER